MIEILGGIHWWPFMVVVAMAYLIPGPDFVVILRSASQQWQNGVLAAVGAQAGLVVHMLIATAGLSVILARHPGLLTVIRLLGGIYLLWLGGLMLRSDGRTDQRSEREGHPLLAAFLTNLLNPKAILFFASVLPQFIAPEHSVVLQILALGLVDIAFGFLPWVLVIALGARLGALLQQRRRRQNWDRATGCTIAALGAWLVLPALRQLRT